LDWDQHIREIGNILYEPDDTGYEYKTFYSGYKGRSFTEAFGYEEDKVYIGYAFSSDGKSWSKYGKVISHPLEDPYVIKVDNTYYLYAEDKADTPFRNIRRWHSSDCKRWVDDGVVLRPRWWSHWESKDVSSPVVWKEGETWYMLYEGRGGGPYNILGGLFELWRHVDKDTKLNTGGKIGLATSVNGIDWVKHQSNPVFAGSGEPGDFDRDQVVPDEMVKIGSTYYLTYHGWNGSAWTSGIGKSSDLTSWVHADASFSPSSTVMVYFDGKDCIAHYYLDDSSGIYSGYLRAGKPAVSVPLSGDQNVTDYRICWRLMCLYKT